MIIYLRHSPKIVQWSWTVLLFREPRAAIYRTVNVSSVTPVLETLSGTFIFKSAVDAQKQPGMHFPKHSC